MILRLYEHKMKIGADTGFLIALVEDEPVAHRHWDNMLKGQDQLVLSVMSVNELLTHCYKRGTGDLAKQAVKWLQELANVAIEPVTLPVAKRGAGYRHGLGMSTADALILATFVLTECDLVLSYDEDFKLPAEQGIIVLQMLGEDSASPSHG